MKIERFLSFEQFILEESCTQRTSAIVPDVRLQ